MAQGSSGQRPAASAFGGIFRWFEDGLFRRIFSNAGLLLSRRAVAALMGLAYLALAAQTLGPESFGALVLVHAYVVVISRVTSFQSWQAVVRYGADCLSPERRTDLQGLLTFSLYLDIGSSAIGAAIAVAAMPWIGPQLGLGPDVVAMAQLYAVLALFMLRAVPNGVLRLFDRFDLLANIQLISPSIRLTGVALAFFTGAGLWAFLLTWFLASLAANLSLMAYAWRELARQRMLKGFRPRLRGLITPHPGLWRFIWTSNLHATLALAKTHGTTLAVGWVLGPAAAGIFKIAAEFANVLVKPTSLLNQTVYPELAKLASSGAMARIGKVVRRAGFVTAAGAAGVVLLAALLGQPILTFAVGTEFLDAYPVMILLVLAAALGLGGFALDPAMFVMGRPDIPLRINVCVTLLYFPAFLLLLHLLGTVGGGIAVVGAAVATLTVSTIATVRLLAGRGPSATPAPAGTAA